MGILAMAKAWEPSGGEPPIPYIRLASAKSGHSANKSRVVSNKSFKALCITEYISP